MSARLQLVVDNSRPWLEPGPERRAAAVAVVAGIRRAIAPVLDRRFRRTAEGIRTVRSRPATPVRPTGPRGSTPRPSAIPIRAGDLIGGVLVALAIAGLFLWGFE